MPTTCYVRLKPLDPGRGHVKARHRMSAACGWGDLMFIAGDLHELDTDAGRWLAKTVHQNEHNPATPMAFDVWYSREECEKALRDEKNARLGRVRRQGANQNAGKPPKLKSAAPSDLDEPAGSTVIESEAADQRWAEASGDLGASAPRDADGNLLQSADGDFGYFAPNDDLVSAALDDATQPAAPQAETRPPAPKRVGRKKTAKKPAAKKSTRRK